MYLQRGALALAPLRTTSNPFDCLFSSTSAYAASSPSTATASAASSSAAHSSSLAVEASTLSSSLQQEEKKEKEEKEVDVIIDDDEEENDEDEEEEDRGPSDDTELEDLESDDAPFHPSCEELETRKRESAENETYQIEEEEKMEEQ